MPLLGWLILGAGALYLVSQAQANAWPPSASVQQGLVTQLATMAQQQTGQALSPAQYAELTSAVNQAPAGYQATLTQGMTPTTSGYQAWVLAQGQAAISSGATLWQPTVSGPLGIQGGDPYPTFDVWGNAYFVDKHALPLIVYNAEDPRGDFPPKPAKVYAGTVDWWNE